jgi:hypothetical protein
MDEADLRAEFRALRDGLNRMANSTDAIVQSLRLMVETQATHGEMLRAVLEAAAEPVGDSPLADTLSRIHTTLQTQTDSLVRLGAIMAGLSGDVETAVIRGVHRAVGDTDDDSGIPEENGDGRAR